MKRMARSRRSILAAAAALLAAGRAPAQKIAAPNLVPITPRLTTSGQPDADSLGLLGQLGYEAVVYLAPASVPDAVRDEPAILARQGIEFVHVPIPFNAPAVAHFDAVSAALDRLRERKVLVHCQVNMRASTLVFLHRAARLREDPAAAWRDVTRVWIPGGPWKKLVEDVLAQHAVGFDPF